MLSALAHGLERHAGRLQAGRLYADYDGGGCAVGVMLRELSPADYRQGRLRFWARRRRHQSVLTERVSFDRSLVTRLSHVEMCFDRTAMTLCEEIEDGDATTAANATGRWMAERCREQLRARNSGFFVPEEWQRSRRRIARRASLPATTGLRRITGQNGTQRLVPVHSRLRPHRLAPATAERRVTARDGSEVRVAIGAGCVLRPLELVPPPLRVDAVLAAA
jgi:hypothetical protein